MQGNRRNECFLIISGCLLAVVAAVTSSTVSACTLFTIVQNDVVLMGNNEDFTKQGAVWFIPASNGKFGRVNVGFHNIFGRREEFAQGSMNEKGLAFDAAVVAKIPWKPDPQKETPDNLLWRIMDECSTVTEAVEYFHNFNCPHLSHSQFMLADASGASVVVTWLSGKGLSIVKREGTAQVATNTRLEASSYRCQRWTRTTKELKTNGRTLFESARQALQAVHQHGPGGFTSYSCIYDLKQRRIHLFNLTNFDEVIQFDLSEELRKGASSHLMKDLFNNSPSLQEIRSKPQRMTYGTQIELSQTELAAFEGIYRFDTAPDIEVRITATATGLHVHATGQSTAELFPESTRSFRLVPDRGQVSFQADKDDRITGLTLHKQQDIRATRVQIK